MIEGMTAEEARNKYGANGGEPIRIAPVGTYGTLYEWPQCGNKRATRYYSTNDEALLKAAVLFLVCSDLGFQVVIDDTSYKNNKQVKIAVGRGTQWAGPAAPDHDFWISVTECRDGHWISVDDQKQVIKTPEEAVARFFELWKQLEVGDYWVDGSQTP